MDRNRISNANACIEESSSATESLWIYGQFDETEAGNSMNAIARTILVIALVATVVVVLLFGAGLMAGPMLETGATGIGGSGRAGLGEFGGYLILMLVDVCLGTVVVWMLFGNRQRSMKRRRR